MFKNEPLLIIIIFVCIHLLLAYGYLRDIYILTSMTRRTKIMYVLILIFISIAGIYFVNSKLKEFLFTLKTNKEIHSALDLISTQEIEYTPDLGKVVGDIHQNLRLLHHR